MNFKYYKYLIFFAVIISCYGCSYKNFSSRSTETPVGILKSRNSKKSQKYAQTGLISLKKDSVEVVQPKQSDSGDEYQKMVDKREQLDRAEIDAQYKDISNFTTLEMSHVSISTSFNPFENNKTIIIDLDDLKKRYTYPVNGKLISDYGLRNGRQHTGVDLKLELGDKVYAIMDGVVRMSKLYGDYGNVIVIRHSNGLESVYSHNNKNLVKSGDKVKHGDVIALGGKTGRATTTHVHFEVRVKGKVIDPHLLINTTTMELESGYISVTLKNGVIYATRTEGKIKAKDISTTSSAKQEKQSVKKSETKTSSTATYTSKSHTVKKGDTLYSIAKKYGTTIDNLCKINNIKKESILKIGQNIKLNIDVR